MRRMILIAALVCCAVVAWAGKGGGGKPPKDPPPAADPAIAYTATGKFGIQNLMVANADGSNQTALAQADHMGSMSWSHDNSQLCFLRMVEGATDLWAIHRIDIDGTDETVLYEFNVPNLFPRLGNPDWSPVPAGDGQYKIAFNRLVEQSGGTYASDIYLMNPDGSGVVNLTDTPSVNEKKPCWSRDGRKLAVIVDTGVAGANHELHVLELTSNGMEISSSYKPSGPTGGPWYGVISARWAKTQDKLVISKDRPGNEMPDLWILDLTNLASPSITQVTDTPAFEENTADWSEDDTSFVFWGGSWTFRNKWNNDMGAWIMPADGSADPVPLLPDAQDAVRWRR